MKTHFDHLLAVVPDLKSRKILDLGSGRGSFLIQCAKNGVDSEGIELNSDYIELSLKRAKEEKVTIKISQGVGERLTYQDNSFDFINLCEVVEHVNKPEEVIKEVYRVLRPNGLVYVSVPNRFGLKDQHFGLYFVNWMPRSWSGIFISVFGKHKDYSGGTGFQKLSEMHYYTFKNAKKLFEKIGFMVSDIREIKIRNKFKNILLLVGILAVYKIIRVFYFDSFHFLLRKD